MSICQRSFLYLICGLRRYCLWRSVNLDAECTAGVKVEFSYQHGRASLLDFLNAVQLNDVNLVGSLSGGMLKKPKRKPFFGRK